MQLWLTSNQASHTCVAAASWPQVHDAGEGIGSCCRVPHRRMMQLQQHTTCKDATQQLGSVDAVQELSDSEPISKTLLAGRLDVQSTSHHAVLWQLGCVGSVHVAAGGRLLTYGSAVGAVGVLVVVSCPSASGVGAV